MLAMNCSDPQNQNTYSDAQGQNTLSNVLAHNFTPYTPRETAAQAGPYASPSPMAIAAMPQSLLTPITPTTEPVPMNVNSLQYLNGALRTQIGRKVTIDFLIGTNTLVDKTGTLLAVGANYLIINEIETDDITFCDFFTIKFVRVYG